MSDWDFELLKKWDDKICTLASDHSLDWFPIIYETCDYYEMIGNMTYHGMPTHYDHWSYGKSFERTHQRYNSGMQGLPYELIINSNPSIAYLMLENPAYLQILIMAHCIGHSDFFKNNCTFSNTNPGSVVTKFKNYKKRIQSYQEDPSIDSLRLESILDSAHALQYHNYAHYKKRIPHAKLKKQYIEKIKLDKDNKYENFDINQIPLEHDYDLLGFIMEHSTKLEDWEKDVVMIVRDHAQYFIPQIRTKIMNEGWASYWHYRLLHELDLPEKYHLPFLKSHNQVVAPHVGQINPYYLGFFMFKHIEKLHGLEECFIARETMHDEGFIRQYLDIDICRELNLFTYAKFDDEYKVVDVSDEEGWNHVKKHFIKNVGINSIPKIYVDNVDASGRLKLVHDYDGRELEFTYAKNTIDHIKTLWQTNIELKTVHNKKIIRL